MRETGVRHLAHLELSHQIDLLELCRSLNRETGTTSVAVLHDLNQAARCADHLTAMEDGGVVAAGVPQRRPVHHTGALGRDVSAQEPPVA
ncbi:hypothetical protein ACH0CV_08225 [Brachybacterium paraconglomeratum]|uniref:hypothetical protein n=1 Tax=Brachybacterium paraconglomeratum TaxID=173362 RepID=UPI00387A69F7